MKNSAAAVLVVLSAVSVSGQLIPPARDMEEAVKMMAEFQRSIEPAINAARDESAVLGTLIRAQNALKPEQPLSSIDDAMQIIDEFTSRRDQVDKPLTKEMQRYLALARAAVLDAKVPPNSVQETRERLHHHFVHQLQVRVARTSLQLQQFSMLLNAINGRFVERTLGEALGNLALAGNEPK